MMSWIILHIDKIAPFLGFLSVIVLKFFYDKKKKNEGAQEVQNKIIKESEKNFKSFVKKEAANETKDSTVVSRVPSSWDKRVMPTRIKNPNNKNPNNFKNSKMQKNLKKDV